MKENAELTEEQRAAEPELDLLNLKSSKEYREHNEERFSRVLPTAPHKYRSQQRQSCARCSFRLNTCEDEPSFLCTSTFFVHAPDRQITTAKELISSTSSHIWLTGKANSASSASSTLQEARESSTRSTGFRRRLWRPHRRVSLPEHLRSKIASSLAFFVCEKFLHRVVYRTSSSNDFR